MSSYYVLDFENQQHLSLTKSFFVHFQKLTIFVDFKGSAKATFSIKPMLLSRIYKMVHFGTNFRSKFGTVQNSKMSQKYGLLDAGLSRTHAMIVKGPSGFHGQGLTWQAA